MTTAIVPNRPVFRAQEVCELADVQPYVLRTWEAEFPDLGVAKGGARVYRRADVERVLRIKHLLFAEGLTLAGARRRLTEEGLAPADEAVTDGDLAALADDATRRQLLDVRRGLQWILGVLAGRAADAGEVDIVRAASAPRAASAHAARSRRSAPPRRPVKKAHTARVTKRKRK